MFWSKLKTRLLSAVILIAVLLIVTFAPVSVFTVALCGVSLILLYEITNTFGLKGKHSIMAVNYIFAILIMASSFLKQDAQGGYFYMVAILFIMALLVVCVLNHEKIQFSDVLASLFSVIYSVVFLLPLSFMRNTQNGLALVFLAFIGAWLPDTMAYFAGSFFGKHKLIPKISPNKTVEGAIGGLLGSVVFYAVYGVILTKLGFSVSFLRMLILSLICGVMSQFGDLSASVIKRAYNKKDFGNLIPGHGGLLDRVDSLIFVTPIVYYFIKFFPVI